MSKELIQFNTRLPEEIVAKVRMDCVRHNLPLEDVAGVIIAEWFRAFTLTERAKQYEGIAKKKIGRPMKPQKPKLIV